MTDEQFGKQFLEKLGDIKALATVENMTLASEVLEDANHLVARRNYENARRKKLVTEVKFWKDIAWGRAAAIDALFDEPSWPRVLHDIRIILTPRRFR